MHDNLSQFKSDNSLAVFVASYFYPILSFRGGCSFLYSTPINKVTFIRIHSLFRLLILFLVKPQKIKV